MTRFIEFLRDVFTAFRSGGGTKFAQPTTRRGGAGQPRTWPGRRMGRTSDRCGMCGLFVKAMCTNPNQPCGVCSDCCPGHEQEGARA